MNRGPKLLLLGLTLVGLLSAAPGAQASNLRYFGGPVAHSMNVVLVPWGAGVRGTYTDPNAGDPAFFGYLAGQSGATSDIGGVLAQYMDTTGHNSQNRFSYGGSAAITPQSASTTVQDSTIQSELARNINSHALPTPAADGMSTIYVVLFPPGTNVCQGGSCATDSNGFCAYHGDFSLSSATHVLYAAMVDNGPGTSNYGYCGSTSIGDINTQTAVVSHEFGETINDPLVADASTWGPPLAWYDQVGGEIGDKCDGRPLAHNGPWTVEPLWSNLDAQCEPAESAYSAPTASFVGPSTATPGQVASFDGSSSTDPSQNRAAATYSSSSYSITSGIVSYQWSWGDGSTSPAGATAAGSHSYATAGTYQVSLSVTDKLGFTSTVTHQLAVGSGTTTPPGVTTSRASAVTAQGAVLNGSINPQNQAVQYKFVYGSSPGALSQSTPLATGPSGTTATPVSATLSGLSASTTYYYELEAVSGGQTYVGSPAQSFTTTAAPPPPQRPVVATGSATQVSSSAAVLTGTVNPNGSATVSYRFSYGTSPLSLTAATPQTTLAGGTVAVPVSAGVSGLSPGTTYYLRLDVSLNGITYSGSVNHFTTTTPRPAVSTGAASAISSSGATVAGTVNPNGVRTAYFAEFGTSKAYGHSTVPVPAGSGTANVAVRVTLTGLRAHSTYHYRLVAMSAGGTAVGSDSTFTTSAASARAPGFSFQPPKHPGRPHGLKVSFSCTRACVAHFVITTLPPGIARGASAPLTLAKGTARLRAAGSGTATLPLARRVHTARGHLKLVISGYADAPGATPSQPQTAQITL